MYGASPKSQAYDRAATMFSPDGRLYQVEYASKIVEQGTLGVAVIYSNGVLFAADKKISTRLIIPTSIEKIFVIDSHMAAVSSGLVGDARRLVEFARTEAQENWVYYDEPITVKTLAKRVAGVMQYFTQYGGVRPFGVAFIFGGFDETGFKLFEAEPSGALAEYKAIAIGKGKKEAMELFEKDYRDSMSKEDAIGLLLSAIKKNLSEKEKLEVGRLDFAFIERNKPLTRVPAEELRAALARSKAQ
ncbi:MAG: archaeal proteasome endopeptidase complex subunit alpha [Candidatus Diapherotrites archaeon]|nr:archaeal proteasome endopeptidase complex subunit alpha [Candidatus Diapherotrites archaeon]